MALYGKDLLLLCSKCTSLRFQLLEEIGMWKDWQLSLLEKMKFSVKFY